MSFKLLRRKSSSPATGGGTGGVSFLHATQNCCSTSLQGDGVTEPAPRDLQVAYAAMSVCNAGETEAVARFFRHELAQRRRPDRSALLLVLNTLNSLVAFGQRSFQFAVIKGANSVLGELERLAQGEDVDEVVATRAAEMLERWCDEFQNTRELSFRIERSEPVMGAGGREPTSEFVQGELTRFDTLLSSLEKELERVSNNKQLRENALVGELVHACDRIGPELRSMIELSSHDSLNRLLEMNDRLLRAIALHEKIAATEPEQYNPFDDPEVMAQVYNRQQFFF